MAHNARIRADKDWVIGLPITSAEWQALDTRLTAAVNGGVASGGGGGGLWTPTANLQIAGAGLTLAATSTINGSASAFVTDGNPLHSLVLGDNDHIELGPGHTGLSRQIASSFDCAMFAAGWDDNLTNAAPASLALGANAAVELRVHNGATFTRVDFGFAVANSHAGGAPATLPQFRVYAQDANGVKTPLQTNGNNGYATFTPIPASGAAWFASGAPQSFTYTLDAAMVIDTSKYHYWAEVIDEQGTNAAIGNIYFDALAYFTNILDLRPQ
jgi:hypothetical protein